MMCDPREKAQRDYLWAIESARQEGMEEGLKLGRQERRKQVFEKAVIVGQLQVLQEFLDKESSSTESLWNRSTEELSSMLDNLQQRLSSRGRSPRNKE